MVKDIPDGFQQPVNAHRLIILVPGLSGEVFGLGVEVVLPPEIFLNLLSVFA